MKTVYIYRGTFDPFHNNHAAICQWCLAQSNISSLVIHINYKEPTNSNQKQPAPWEIRFDLVSSALNSFTDDLLSDVPWPRALVSTQKEFAQTLECVINQFGSDTRIVQVLGDDVLKLMKDSLQIHSYAIHQRDCAEYGDLTPFLFNKERINIPLKLPNISSTHIRSLLIKREMNQVSEMVPNSVFLLLKKLKDYSSLHLSLQELKKSKIHVSDLFAQQLEEYFGETIYLKYEPEVFSGLSGDFLVSVFSLERGRIAICKLFAQHDNCAKELLGYEQLSKHVKTPHIYFICNEGFCMELILGKNAQSVHDFTRVGQAYHALHTNSMSDIKGAQPEQMVYFKNKIKEVVSQFTDVRLAKKIQFHFALLLEKYYDTSCRLSITHGDAQPGNTLVKEGEVVFIDASKVKELGDPSSDIHQMIASIYWKAYNNHDTENVEDIQKNIEAFLEGYGGRINSPSFELWSFYWRTRTLLLAIKAPTTPLSEHIITSFKIDYLQSSEFQSQNHPFWNLNTPSSSSQETTSIQPCKF